MVANRSFESWQGGALDDVLRKVVPQGGRKWIERHYGNSQPAEGRVKGNTIEIANAKTRSWVWPKRVWRGAQVVEYLEEVAQDSNVTAI